MKTLLKEAFVISPDFEMEGASVLVEDGKITRIYSPEDNHLPSVDQVFDIQGDFLVPGFVDVHTHGAAGADFCDGTLTAIEKMAEAKLKEGVTTLLPTTVTIDEKTLSKALESAAKYKEHGEKFCKIPGVHLEGPYINPKCLGAQDPAFVRVPDIEEVKRLNAIFPVRKVSFAIEEKHAPEFTSELLGMGITPSCVHSAATFADFKKGYERGLRNLSHFCNQMTPLHHREIGLVGAGLSCEDVSLELICDKIHLCPDMISLIFSLHNTEKIQLITDSVRASGMPDGEYKLGDLTFHVKNGEARLPSGALAGSTLQFNQAFANVFETTGYALSDLVKTTSWNQAQSLNLPGIGKIAYGYAADLVVLSGDFNVQKVFVNGDLRFSL